MPVLTDHLSASFGVEIECYLPPGLTRNSAAAAVAHRLGAPCILEGYNHDTRHHWKCVTDGSLGDYDRGTEFVSPPMIGPGGFAQVEKVCRALADLNCTVSKRCGLHVHVGVGHAPLDVFKNAVKLYAAFEPVIDTLVPPSRRKSENSFARSITTTNPAKVNAATSLPALIDVVTGHVPEPFRRNFKLNLKAWKRHKTIEFRQHSGTLDHAKVSHWAAMCMRIIAAAKRGNLNLGSAATSTLNVARPGTKAHRIGQMFLRPEGVTGQEVMAEMNWPSVSMPQQARSCGIAYTTLRTGRVVRYFAQTTAVPSSVPITLTSFADLLGVSDEERAFMSQRVADLGGPVAASWAA